MQISVYDKKYYLKEGQPINIVLQSMINMELDQDQAKTFQVQSKLYTSQYLPGMMLKNYFNDSYFCFRVLISGAT